MKVINRLSPFWILLFATLSTVFMIEAGAFSPWVAAFCGAVSAFGLNAAIRGAQALSGASVNTK